MANMYYEGMVPMCPEIDKMRIISEDDDVCCFMVPAIYYKVMNEVNEEESVYDWRMDSLVMANKQRIVKYIESTCIEVLLKDKNGELDWVNGKLAEIVGIDIEGREDARVAKEYIVEMYDLEKGEKKRGKVVFDEPSPMSEYDFLDLRENYSATCC